MSMDRSLKSASSLVRHRNVLTRAERMDRLTEQDKFPVGRSILGLPKVGNRKLEVGKAPKAEAAEGDAAAPAAKGAKGAKGAVAAKGAPAAKGAAAAKGAPAAKGAAAAKGAPAVKGAPAAKKK